MHRDEDVLDTWFSSALWPFSTLGWPEDTPEVRKYYPTDVLVTGFDIIFFWVARMMMMGIEFMGTEPFHTVYVHALVRDEHGAKMSKTKGNVIDPLSLVDEYGADATRFTLAAMAAQGRDMRLAMSRVEGYRNFVTKLWNAARFLEMNGCVRSEGFEPSKVSLPVNRWIIGCNCAGRRRCREVDRGLQVQRSRQCRLRLRLGHLLRLVCGTGEADSDWGTVGGKAGDAGDRRLCARPDPEASPSLHAVRHRGVVE